MQHPAVFVPCYLRLNSLRAIVEESKKYGIRSFYFSIDKTEDIRFFSQQKMILSYLESLSDLNVKIRISLYNIGCALNVTSGIDWALSNTDEIIVIEDDCIPTKEFFRFIDQSKKYFNSSHDILTICGTQFVDLPENSIIKSRYPFFWGWYINDTKWQVMKNFFLKHSLPSNPTYKVSISEKSYWRAGHRRAMNRYVDVWDTIATANMVFQNYTSIVPSKNLVKNIGDDNFATNVTNSKFTHRDVLKRSFSWSYAGFKESQETLVRENIYEISNRHLITNKLRFLQDIVSRQKKKMNFAVEFSNFLNSDPWNYF